MNTTNKELYDQRLRWLGIQRNQEAEEKLEEVEEDLRVMNTGENDGDPCPTQLTYSFN